jgi:hypothetical protein
VSGSPATTLAFGVRDSHPVGGRLGPWIAHADRGQLIRPSAREPLGDLDPPGVEGHTCVSKRARDERRRERDEEEQSEANGHED